jgi:hypothetical protein
MIDPKLKTKKRKTAADNAGPAYGVSMIIQCNHAVAYAVL